MSGLLILPFVAYGCVSGGVFGTGLGFFFRNVPSTILDIMGYGIIGTIAGALIFTCGGKMLSDKDDIKPWIPILGGSAIASFFVSMTITTFGTAALRMILQQFLN
jgi:hypothetical protein